MSIIYDSLQSLKVKQISAQIPGYRQVTTKTGKSFRPYRRAGLYTLIFVSLILILIKGLSYLEKEKLSDSKADERKAISEELHDKDKKARIKVAKVENKPKKEDAHKNKINENVKNNQDIKPNASKAPAKGQDKDSENKQEIREKSLQLGRHIQVLQAKVQSELATSNNSHPNRKDNKEVQDPIAKKGPKTRQGEKLNPELQTRFSSRAKKNRRILAMQNKLKTLLHSKDLKKAEMVLQRLEEVLDKDNLFVRKWKGVLALQQKDYTVAERCFRKIWERNNIDLETGINLVLALMGQRKFGQAKEIHNLLLKKYPQNPMLDRIDFLSNM